MQKTSKDWKQTLIITRSFLENKNINSFYLAYPISGIVVSKGFIQGSIKVSIETLPSYSNIQEQLTLTILERFKEMEKENELPHEIFLYSFIIDILRLYKEIKGIDSNEIKEVDPDFNKILDDIFNVLVAKSDDYGQAFRSIGYTGIRARIWEKICRFISLSSIDDVNYESREDSIKDLLGYMIILLALRLE